MKPTLGEGGSGHQEEPEAIIAPWLKQKAIFQEYYADLLDAYLDLELTLPIEDPAMRRICQVLSNIGFITHESCEGHGERLPEIFFTCEDQLQLRNLTHIVTRGAQTTHQWGINLYSSDPYMNVEQPLYFVLQPQATDQVIAPKTEHKALLKDLDILALAITKSLKKGWWAKREAE